MSNYDLNKKKDKIYDRDKRKDYGGKSKIKKDEKNKPTVKQGPFPYNFVPVKPDLTIKDSPSDHLCLELEDKNCGEINLSITTLTPTICGHFQTEFNNISDNLKKEINEKLYKGLKENTETDKDKGFDGKKHVIEPLILDDGNGKIGPVIIPSTSIKGMIRQSVCSLLSAPMSKVEERQYSYRPNLSPDDENIGTIIPAFVERVNEDGSVNVCVSTMKDFYFCHNSLNIKLIPKGKKLVKLFKNYSLYNSEKKIEKNCNKLLRSKNSSELLKKDGVLATYHSGLDGEGVLAEIARRKKYPNSKDTPRKAYGWGYFEKCERDEVNIPVDIVNHFYKTLNLLVKQNEDDKSSLSNQLKNTLKGQADNKLENGDIVFLELRAGCTEVELDGSNIVSMGFNFRYRWMYRDSVNIKDGVLRQEIFDLSKEEFDKECGIPKETNMQRSLFGFVDDKSKNSLAGRISPNSAIEQIDKKADDDRFVKPKLYDSYYFVLKPLGSPKPSAVEMYLTQNNIDKRKDQGVVCTYGDTLDDESAGDLRGRKGYLHQSECSDKASYLNNPREESYLSEQSSIVGYVSKSGTIFKSKIRFQNLENWELGALIMAISPKPEYVKKLYEKMDIEKPDFKEFEEFITSPKDGSYYFAQKIGHGRPLGLGSIFCKIDGLNLLKDNENGTIDFNKQENINKYIEAFADKLIEKLQDKKQDWFNQIFLKWLKIRVFANTKKADYYKGDDKKIFSYHTEVRRKHSSGRKKAGSPKLSDKVLNDL